MWKSGLGQKKVKSAQDVYNSGLLCITVLLYWKMVRCGAQYRQVTFAGMAL